MIYDYLIVRQRIDPSTTEQVTRKLCPWYRIELIRELDRVRVVFYSDIHVDKRVELPITFSAEFSDRDILGDANLHVQVFGRWGRVLEER